MILSSLKFQHPELFQWIYIVNMLRQVSASSTTSPRYLTTLVLLIVKPSIEIRYGVVTGSLSILFSLFWKPITINSVLTVFKLSLFDLSQSHIFRKGGIRLSLISLTDLMLLYKRVSSAYILIWALVTKRGRSFMYIMNNKGPKIDACRTPYSIFYLIIFHSHCNIVFCFPGMIQRNSIHHPGYHTGTVSWLSFGDQLYQMPFWYPERQLNSCYHCQYSWASD